MIALALLALACTTESDAPEASATAAQAAAGAAAAGAAAAGIVITWLDDDTRAASVSHYRIGGTVTGPLSEKAKLRTVARDALADRATTLGFVRLDNLQIELSCTEPALDAPENADKDSAACKAKVVAIASH